MPSLIRTVFRLAGRDWVGARNELLVTNLGFKILDFAILAPLVGLALRMGIGLSGEKVLADQDILFFLLRPIGLVVLIIMSALLLALIALEQAGLMTIGLAAAETLQVDMMGALRFAFRRAVPIADLAVRLTIRCLLLVTPFIGALALVYFSLLGEFDINYYLSERPPAFIQALGLALLLLGGLAWVLLPRLIGWSLALPLVLFEGVSPGEALGESRRRVGARRSSVAMVLVLWGCGSFLASLVLPSLVLGLGRLLGPLGTNRVGLVLALMLFLLILWLLVSAAVSSVSASLFALLVVRLYKELGGGIEAIDPLLEEAAGLASRQKFGFTVRRSLAVLAAMAIAAAGLGTFLLEGLRAGDDVLIIAHRGAPGVAPENTMASIEEALDQATDVVEIDVQETLDGEVVVIHDSDLMKIAGLDLKIWDATWPQLQTLDVGSWFAPEFADQRVPHLREVLEASRGRALVDIELKYYGHDVDLERRVVDLVEALGVGDNVLVMSLRYAAVKKMKALRPAWKVGLLTATAVGDLTRLEVDFLAVNAPLATRGFVRRAHKRGLPVYVWTINDPVQMFRMVNQGVDGLITDEPGLARSVLEQRAELNSVERLLVGIAYFFGASAPDPDVSVDIDPDHEPAL